MKLQWAAVLLSILCTTLRAFNVGYNAQLYLISCIPYMVFALTSQEQTQRLLNWFYLAIALIGVLRWK